jgi:hypothetical protein
VFARTLNIRLAAAAACRTIALSLAIASPLAAQAFPSGPHGEEQHIIRVGFGGGMTVPVSNARDAFKGGVNGQGFVLIQLPGGLPALRFAASYDQLSLKPTIANPARPGEDEAGHSKVIGGVGGIKFHLIPGPVRPYVMAGVGAFNISDLTSAASGTAASASTSTTNFGVDGGAGIEIKLGRFSGFVEGRIQNIYSGNLYTGSGALVSKSSIQSVPVTFGFIF